MSHKEKKKKGEKKEFIFDFQTLQHEFLEET